MSSGARLLVIQPDDLGPLGRFSGWLTDRGIALDTLRPFAGDTVPETVDADGLIVLGGSMSSLDTAEYPWLGEIRALLVDAYERAIPTLGICLGSQLLAQALGGQVESGRHGLEVGAVEVTLDPVLAPEDEVLGGCAGASLTVAQYHSDAITRLPAGAHLLASSQMYPVQAFRAGRSWGLQFHPEVPPTIFARWVDHETGISTEKAHRLKRALADVESKDRRIRDGVAPIAERFGNVVLASTRNRV